MEVRKLSNTNGVLAGNFRKITSGATIGRVLAETFGELLVAL